MFLLENLLADRSLNRRTPRRVRNWDLGHGSFGFWQEWSRASLEGAQSRKPDTPRGKAAEHMAALCA